MKSIRFEDFEILIKEILMLDKDISLKKLNLLEIGLNSLQTMRIVNRLKQMGAVISFAELMEKPYIEKWWEILSERMKLEDLLSDQKDTKAISKESNSLTDVQYAYWIGRGKKQILGGVSCHAYFEFKGSVLDIGKLKEAWHKIQYRHPMLRARFLENGTQQIIERNKFSNELLVYDLRGKQSEIEEHLLKVRTTNSHRVFDIEKGHVASLEVTIINNKEYVIHFDIDLLVADLKSIRIVLNDLAALYGEKYLPELPDNVNFMNYIVNTKQSDYIKDREYWNQKMDDMPGMPELPICKKIIQIKKPVFKRRNFFLDENRWRRLLEICAFRQVTPAMVLLSLYAEVLGKFSNSSRFIINVPFFGRPLDVENINFVVGDFTNILLLPIDISGKNQFIDQVYNITEIFMEVMKHNSYSGVEVIRDLLKKDAGNKLIAPVVFSCNYDETMVPALFEKKLGKLDYISTQTPQVLIDFQILKMTEGILFSWDVVDEAFCKGTIDTMFDCYTKALEHLIEQPDIWNKKIEFVEANSFPERYENITTLGKTKGYIHDKVFLNMEKKSKNIAVFETDTHKSITYQELQIEVENLSWTLIEAGVHKEDKVGIYLPKGSSQIVAVLAILGIGACYVPIGVNQPLQRMKGMLLKANIKTIISDENGGKYLQENVQQNIVLVNTKNERKSSYDTIPDSPEKSSYVIFTSGTTGDPKGVEISHRSAWNTISEVNKICCVDEYSKILSVSALEFDLSVYDIFGILSEGGTVVVVSENARRDAAVWANAIVDYSITIWNSVPYLLNMLLTVAETEGKVFSSLKKVILSGDWIGLDLPERLKKIAPNAEMVAMGGATEAAIWSNFIKVQLPLPSKWVSIPYGKPLAGQLYRVVDQTGKDCPNWVSGELWIGGDGVAKGYIGDDALTEEKFVYEGGIRWYKTGDMGRFWSDGTIEFLGRKDTQVKVRGHRIELGEIESVLNQYPGIIGSVVDVVGIKESKKIYAYIISRQKNLDFESIEQFLKSYLPEYMIPSKFVIGEKMPLSLNGKVERSYVRSVLEDNLSVESANYEEPIGTTEIAISSIWKEVLKVEKLSRNDDFFEIGGDSLKAVSIMSQLKQKNLVPINTSVQILFTDSTIKKFAEQINRLNMEENQETEINTI